MGGMRGTEAGWLAGKAVKRNKSKVTTAALVPLETPVTPLIAHRVALTARTLGRLPKRRWYSCCDKVNIMLRHQRERKTPPSKAPASYV